MAGIVLSKRTNSKIQTKNAILRLKNGSLRVINREKLNEKFVARIRSERQNLLDKHRDVAEAELRQIAADILQNEWILGEQERLSRISSAVSDNFDLEKELMLEEEFDRESFQEYDNWLQSEIDHLLSSEGQTEECLVVCPVCCRQCFNFTGSMVECGHCCMSYPLNKSMDALRADINCNLAEHNDSCCYHPQFVAVPDSGGKNCMLMLCHVCSYLKVLL